MKVLFLDVETSPNIVYSWCVGRKVNLSFDNIIKERQIICICWKWKGENKVYSVDWGKKQNDKQLLKDFSKVINEADIVAAHNGDRYDLKFINGRLAYHDLPPIAPVTSIDTLKQSRKTFFINSHALDYLGEYFDLGRKLPTGFKLWKDVMDGNQTALNKMIRYCKQDVKLLEKAFDKIQKYAPQTVHMGIAVHGDRMACKSCGSMNTIWRGKMIKSKIFYRRRSCKDCNHWWTTEVRA